MQKFIFEVFSPFLNLTNPIIFTSYLHILLHTPSIEYNCSFIRNISSSSCKLDTRAAFLHQAKVKSGCPSVVSQCAPLFRFRRHPSQLNQDRSPPSFQKSLVFPLSRLVFHPFCSREGMNTAWRNTSQKKHLPRPRRKHPSVTCSENHYHQAPLSMSVISSSMLERAMCNGSLKKPAKW